MPTQDRTYSIEIRGDQTGRVVFQHAGMDGARLALIGELVKEHGPKVAAVTEIARSAEGLADAIGKLLSLTPARRKVARRGR